MNYEYILKVAFIVFVDGLEVSCAMKRGVIEDVMVFGLSNWNGIVINKMRKNLGGNVKNLIWDMLSLRC